MLKFLVLNVITWGWFMKFSQKAKYFIYGVVAVGVLVPLAIKAVDTIPLTFNKGDVVSASVLNSLFSRLNDVQTGFSSGTDIVGTWACTTYSAQGGCMAGFTATGGGVLNKATQNITFACNAGVCTYTAASFYPASCQTNGVPLTQTYELNSNMVATSNGVNSIQKINPNKFFWNVVSSLPPLTYVICEKPNQVPAPVTTLAIAYANGSATLTWTDANADNTGYIVQRSVDSGTTWTTINTITSAATLTYTDTGLTTGTTYQYQVIATNANGNSIGSSVVQAAL